MRGDNKAKIVGVLIKHQTKLLSKYRVAKLADCSYSWTHEFLAELEAKGLVNGTRILDINKLKEAVQFKAGSLNKKERLIILAAGVGSRSLPLTEKIPKCLMTIGSQTILERIISQKYANGIEHVSLVVGHKKELIEEELIKLKKRYSKLKVKTIFNPDYKITNNIYSLWLAKEHAKGGFYLVDGDLVVEKEIIDKIVKTDMPNFLLVDDKKTPEEEDVKVQIDSSGIFKIGKHIDLESSHGISVGIAKFSEEGSKILFEEIQKRIDEGKKNVFYEEAFEAMASRIRLDTVSTEGYKWSEIDFLNEYEEAKKVFK